MTEAMQTPILDLLRDVPEDARQVYEHDSMHSQNIPFGRLAAEAADEIERLRAALVAQPAEPVAWMLDTTGGKLFMATDSKHNGDWLPLYTAPPAPAAVPLTDEQIMDAVHDAGLDWHRGWTAGDAPNRYSELARAIERAHGIAASPEKKP